MSNTAEELKDTLNDIERDVYDGIDLGDMFTKAYVLADELGESIDKLREESAKLRELARGLHMAYVGALNEAEGMDEGLIWEHCEMVDAELAKSHARFEADRHRFDVALRELGVEVDE